MIADAVGSDSTGFLAGCCLLAAAYCTGGLHGLWLAWSQPVRMQHWAKRVEVAQLKINEWEDKADGVLTDRELRRLRRLAGGPVTAQGNAVRAQSGPAGVDADPAAAALHEGPGSPAVRCCAGDFVNHSTGTTHPRTRRALCLDCGHVGVAS